MTMLGSLDGLGHDGVDGVMEGVCFNILGLLLALNDDTQSWKCATPFLAVLSEQEVRYLAPTMAGWQLMAKVGARAGEGGS